MKKTKVVIITGMSGSGKTVAGDALEDLGFFCVDNLPADLVEKLIQLSALSQPGDLSRFAIVMDLRDPTFSGHAAELFSKLREQGHQLDIVFLDAADSVLLRRYKETRRAHPQGGAGMLAEAIERERILMSELRSIAGWVLDTSTFTPHDLRRIIQERFSGDPQPTLPAMRLTSFGFKHGLPGDADLVMDVRFLPNPHFVEALRPLTGQDGAVADYVLKNDLTQEFLRRFVEMLTFLVPLYRDEGKSYLTIAIGCTGGRHRSVAIAQELARRLATEKIKVAVQHRDLAK